MADGTAPQALGSVASVFLKTLASVSGAALAASESARCVQSDARLLVGRHELEDFRHFVEVGVKQRIGFVHDDELDVDDDTFDLADLSKAFQHQIDNKHFGKISITMES